MKAFNELTIQEKEDIVKTLEKQSLHHQRKEAAKLGFMGPDGKIGSVSKLCNALGIKPPKTKNITKKTKNKTQKTQTKEIKTETITEFENKQKTEKQKQLIKRETEKQIELTLPESEKIKLETELKNLENRRAWLSAYIGLGLSASILITIAIIHFNMDFINSFVGMDLSKEILLCGFIGIEGVVAVTVWNWQGESKEKKRNPVFLCLIMAYSIAPLGREFFAYKQSVADALIKVDKAQFKNGNIDDAVGFYKESKTEHDGRVNNEKMESGLVGRKVSKKKGEVSEKMGDVVLGKKYGTEKSANLEIMKLKYQTFSSAFVVFLLVAFNYYGNKITGQKMAMRSVIVEDIQAIEKKLDTSNKIMSQSMAIA